MWIALALTSVAGAATMMGALFAFARTMRSPRAIGYALAGAAGAMIGVSVLELFPEASHALGTPAALLWVGMGALGVLALNAVAHVFRPTAAHTELPCAHCERAVPHPVGGHVSIGDGSRAAMLRAGLVAAFALTLHNIPEGFATFASALHSPTFAVPLVAAIALHNIPEGLAVAVPILEATGSKARALTLTALSGFSEPVGALALYVLLGGMPLDDLWPPLAGLIVGVMVAMSVCELLPLAKNRLGWGALALGTAAGAGVMGLSLLALGAAQ